MPNTAITTPPTLKTKLLAAAIIHSARLLREQQEQAPTAAPPVTTPPTPDQAAQQQPPAVPEAQPQATAAVGPAIDQVIAKLNDIRAGKSFEDPNTYAKLSAVYNGMDEQTKALLDKALGDVATAVQPQPPPEAQQQPATQQQQPAAPAAMTAQPSPQQSVAPAAAPAV